MFKVDIFILEVEELFVPKVKLSKYDLLTLKRGGGRNNKKIHTIICTAFFVYS